MDGLSNMDHTKGISVEQDIDVKQESGFDGHGMPTGGTKRPRSFGNEPFSEIETRQIRQRLDVGLSRAETMQRPGPGGSRLTYIEGWKVIHDANQIFGFNGWSSSISALDIRFVDSVNGRHSACVCATVRVTLRDGASHEDRGGGIAENMRSKGEAILKAEKEAVTDATKRALKNFGLRLGLSLYDRQHLRDMNRPQPPQQAQVVKQEPGRSTHQQQHEQLQRAAAVGASVTKARTCGTGLPGNGNGHDVSGLPQSLAVSRAIAAHVGVNMSKQEDALQRQFVMNAGQQNSTGNGSSSTHGMNLQRHTPTNSTVMGASTSIGVSAPISTSVGVSPTSRDMQNRQNQAYGNNRGQSPAQRLDSTNDLFTSHGLTVSGASSSAMTSITSSGLGNYGAVDLMNGTNSSGVPTRSTTAADLFDRVVRNNNVGLHPSRIQQQEIDELSAIALADF